MTTPKVIGTEVEYGITVLNQEDFNPVLASSAVINSYEGARARIQWSFEEETPGRDARGFGHAAPVEVDSGLVNVVLTNGARFYVDHAHPEFSTPECVDPRQAALYERAGEEILHRAARSAQRLLADGERLVIHKNNSDGKGNSYGAHENYLLARSLPFSEIVEHFTAFLVTRQIFTGSGKVGSENGRPAVGYQISQRADFFEEEVGLETTLKRPIVNTRDEPHADTTKYRRLHVIIGDATLSEYQTMLKLGTAALVLGALEAGALPESIGLRDPVAEVWQVSHDPTLRHTLELDDGTKATALELQWRYLEWAAKYRQGAGLPAIYDEVLAMWEETLQDLEVDPLRTADRLDWTAKLRLLEGYRDRDGLDWDAPKLRLLNLQYHDVDPERGLQRRLVATGRMRRLFDADEIERAIVDPPTETRAYFRGECMRRYRDALVAANWDSLVFDVGEEMLKRVPMMEPLRGTKERVGALFDRCDDAAALIRALGGDDG
ncbi:MAG TPA: proteasome accessory factor PafA2 [Actinobacteria bacterium]|nr:proteasome accessory factor PafA2 [Actinomycetota bacterium]